MGCVKLNILGRSFGRLTVLSEDIERPKGKRNRIYWICQCECGRTLSVEASRFKQGIQSCGCIRNEKIGNLNLKHGEARKTVENRAWFKIKSRCHSPTDPKYPLYGGKGIIVCEKWRNSYEEFLKDMGRRPPNKTSIDRFPNKNGNYEPGNCRWANAEEQANNLRTNLVFEWEDKEYTLSQLSKAYNINYKKAHRLIRYKGISISSLIQNHGKL